MLCAVETHERTEETSVTKRLRPTDVRQPFVTALPGSDRGPAAPHEPLGPVAPRDMSDASFLPAQASPKIGPTIARARHGYDGRPLVRGAHESGEYC